MPGGKPFQTTGAQTAAHAVFVLGAAIKERIDDLSDLRVSGTRLEIRLFK